MRLRKNEVRRIVCDYVKANGPQSRKTLHEIVLIASGRNLNEKDWGNSYLDNVSNNSLLFPSKFSNMCLVRSSSDGLYHLAENNGDGIFQAIN